MAALALYIDCNANRGINVAPSCGGGRPRKILQAHGSNDQTIPYDALDNGYRHLPRINWWVGWWAQRNGCTDKQQPFESNGYQKVVWSSCMGVNNAVQHYKVDGLGHCWPDNTDQNNDYKEKTCGSYALDFTDKVLEFFGARTL